MNKEIIELKLTIEGMTTEGLKLAVKNTIKNINLSAEKQETGWQNNIVSMAMSLGFIKEELIKRGVYEA